MFFLRFCIQMCRINRCDLISTILFLPISKVVIISNAMTQRGLGFPIAVVKGEDYTRVCQVPWKSTTTCQKTRSFWILYVRTQELAAWVEIEYYMKICLRHIQYHITKSTLITPRGPDGAVWGGLKKRFFIYFELFSKNYDKMSRMIYMSCR